MSLLRHLWTQEEETDPAIRSEIAYVVDLRNRIDKTLQTAQEHLKDASTCYARQYNRKAKDRWFEPNDQVLLLLPVKRNKLQLSWQGPYRVIERVGDTDYKVHVRGRPKVFHANLLRKYWPREQCAVTCPVVVEDLDPTEDVSIASAGVPTVPLSASETWKDVSISPTLHKHQADELRGVCKDFGKILTDLPLRSTVGECTLVLKDQNPVRAHQYPLPHSQVQTIQQEVEAMLKMGVIERAASPYSTPIVLVKKKDGTIRFCVNYRKLNVTYQ